MHIPSHVSRWVATGATCMLAACSAAPSISSGVPAGLASRASAPYTGSRSFLSVVAPKPPGWQFMRPPHVSGAGNATTGTLFATGDPPSGGTFGFGDVFPAQGQNQAPAGSLTGGSGAPLELPQGMAVDQSGNTYLTDTETYETNVYAPGATQPTKTLFGNAYPAFVAIGPDGTVYVSCMYTPTNNGPGPGLVEAFPPGSNTVTKTFTDPNFLQVMGVAVDKNNDLYVAYNAGGAFQNGTIAVFKGGTTTASETGINLGIAGGIALDKAGHLLADNQNSGIQAYDPKTYKELAQIVGGNPVGFAFGSTGSKLYVANALFGDVEVYNYSPATFAVKEVDSIYTEFWQAGYQPIGAAVSPAMPDPI